MSLPGVGTAQVGPESSDFSGRQVATRLWFGGSDDFPHDNHPVRAGGGDASAVRERDDPKNRPQVSGEASERFARAEIPGANGGIVASCNECASVGGERQSVDSPALAFQFGNLLGSGHFPEP